MHRAHIRRVPSDTARYSRFVASAIGKLRHPMPVSWLPWGQPCELRIRSPGPRQVGVHTKREPFLERDHRVENGTVGAVRFGPSPMQARGLGCRLGPGALARLPGSSVGVAPRKPPRVGAGQRIGRPTTTGSWEIDPRYPGYVCGTTGRHCIRHAIAAVRRFCHQGLTTAHLLCPNEHGWLYLGTVTIPDEWRTWPAYWNPERRIGWLWMILYSERGAQPRMFRPA